MARNKVILKGETLIDLTGDTVTAETLGKGATAHDKAGNQIVGTMESISPSEKFGATIDTFIGDLSADGTLSAVTKKTNLIFTGVKTIADSALKASMQYNRSVENISFPDLIDIGISALQYAFSNSYAINASFLKLEKVEKSLAFYGAFDRGGLEEISFSNLKEVSAQSAFWAICSSCNLLTNISFPKLEKISGTYCFYNAFSDCNKLTNVSFPELVSITGQQACYQMFYSATGIGGLVEIEFPKLISVEGAQALNSAFNGCRSLSKVSFPALKKVTGNSVLANLTSVAATISFPVLQTIGSDTNVETQHLTNLHSEEMTFPELLEIYCTNISSGSSYATFRSTYLKKLYLPKLHTIAGAPNYTGDASKLNAHKTIFAGCSNLTELHFGAANQAAIEASDGYPTLWGLGAGKATVYFDL